jgi:predicted  nucleic acid-binding Zn-ribbon protein
MITPILKDPKKHGGTLYTFPSASRDLTRSFSNSEYEFAFSHFACLNLPDFRYGKFKDGDLKGVYLNNLHPYSLESINNLNESLKWHLQSYVMNYEVAILNGFSLDSGKYDSEILRTPSERVFFSWLQKVGAIKFGTNSETLIGYGDDADIGYITVNSESDLKDKTKSYRIGNKLYVWKGGEWRSRVLVSNTVQYIGIIDMVNNVNIDYDSFNEIYLNIPSSVGGSTKVVFNNIFDANYEKGETIDVDIDDYCTNAEYIIGRDPELLNMTHDKTLTAIYDSTYESSSESESDSNSDYYLGEYLEHYYKIDSGYCIDFSDNKYGDGKGGVGIEKMNMSSEEDFEFNCVLIYYKIRKGGGDWFTNLYGVLFLEEAATSDYNINLNEEDEIVGYIQRYPKFKRGNSWGLKLDLKIDAQPDSQMVLRDTEYDDPNEGVGMQMFTEALVHLNDCAKIFYEVKQENTDIEERLYKLENIVSGIDTVYELRDSVIVLRNSIETIQPIVNSFEGRLVNNENLLEKIKSDLGYLINDIKELNRNFTYLKIDVADGLNNFKEEIESYKSYIDNDIEGFKKSIGESINQYMGNINKSIYSLQNNFNAFKSDVNVEIEKINKGFVEYKSEVDNNFVAYTLKVDAKFETLTADLGKYIDEEINKKAQITIMLNNDNEVGPLDKITFI